VKRGVHHVKRRKNILKKAKGYKWGRKSKLKLAKTAVAKAGKYAYRDRRAKKRSMRSLWLVRLNAAVRESDMSYSAFISQIKKKGIVMDRKVLSTIAAKHPAVFKKIIEAVR